MTKHLNVWIQTDQALFDMPAWERCTDPSLRSNSSKENPASSPWIWRRRPTSRR